MDPVSAIGLASAVVGIFKETYLVGDWIYKMIRSGMRRDKEREEIEEEFYTELLKLASFGHLFVKCQGNITNASELDKQWLGFIYRTFEQLSHDFGEYAALVGKEAGLRYKTDARSQELGGFLQLVKEPPKPSSSGARWIPKIFQSKKISESELVIGAKWALFRAERLRRVVVKFQKRNDSLQNILPMAVASWVQQNDYSNSPDQAQMIDNLATDENAQRLGLSKHVKIRGLIRDPKSSEQPELHLKNTRIISTEEKSTLHFAEIETVVGRGNSNRQEVLIEYKSYGPPREQQYSQMRSDVSPPAPTIPPTVSQLGSLLFLSGDNSMGTLPFMGYLNQPSNGRVAFIFYFPEKTQHSAPCSLHEIIQISNTEQDPLELGLGFQFAHFLASTLGKLHVDRWIHKNITSHSLVFFREYESGQCLFGNPYLVDFEFSRPDTGSSLRLVDSDYEQNLYRHPDIQRESRPSFHRSHDIYALGVVLLEIAMSVTAHDIVQRGIPNPSHRTAENIRRLYEKAARVQVPWKMGAAYSRAVLACLTSQFQDDFNRPDFPSTFRAEIVGNLSAKLLMDYRGQAK